MEIQKLLFTRLLSSVLWSILLHVFPLTLYLLLTNFNVVHPVKWVKESCLQVFTLGNWLYLSPTFALMFVLGFFQFREFATPPTFSATRFQAFCNIFNKINTIKGLVYFLLGVTIPWLYLGLNGCSLTEKCTDFSKHVCINESTVFLTASGIWTGLYYFIRSDLCTEKYLQFPIIQQLKFLQIKSQVYGVLKQSMKLSTVPIFYFVPFYYWYGSRILLFVQVLFKAHNTPSTLTTVSGLFNMKLFIHAWLISTVFIMTVMTVHLMMQIHFTERYSFELVNQPNSELMLLSTAMAQQNKPLIQHLAYYDLFIISTNPNSLRWQIFTLSQPGGHPHTWNGILNECLKLMNNFIYEIEDIYKVPEPVKPPPPIPKHIHMHELTPREQEILSGPVPLSLACKLRNLVVQQPRTELPESKSKFDELRERINSHLAEIYKNPAINYLFGAIPDAKIRFLISNSQPIIWATQSISELAAKALIEDKFGIVLKDLPFIIETLLQLKSCLEKLGTVQRKLQKREHDICMRSALKSAVKRSLYKISIAYSDYLNDLPLSPENHKSMQSFVLFKEC